MVFLGRRVVGITACPKHRNIPSTVEHGLACNRVEVQVQRSKRHTAAKYTICRHARGVLDSSADGAVHMEARLTDPDNTDRLAGREKEKSLRPYNCGEGQLTHF